MSEVAKHTPGPWVLCAHLRDGDKCSCGYRGVIYGPGGAATAVCQPGHEPAPAGQEGTEPARYPRSVEIANAHLIAAAPELLEALKYAAGLLEYGGFDMSKIDAAIAKADGRS